VTAPQWLVAWAGDEGGSILEVTAGGGAAEAVAAHVPALVADGVASGIARGDGSLWGPAAVSEASKRLGWVDVERASRPVVARVEALRAELAAEGVDRVVLCGMGGSSLAPEVITRTHGAPLVVLDGTDPGQVRAALVDLGRTVVVVSSKSGSTVETDSQRRAFEAAFGAAGIDAKRRIVVVTDPGSPLEQASLAAGYRAVFQADPTVGGRFSALTAFGLVPSGLAGVDVGALLDEAGEVVDLLADDAEGNPALVLGAALGGTDPLRDKVVFVDEGSGIVGFADWAEQLIAESTGKEGTGLLPVVVEGPEAPEVTGGPDGWADVLVVRLVSGRDESGDPGSAEGAPVEPAARVGTGVTVAGPLGAQLLLWEYATSVAGRLLGINPFDQPDVESAKTAARGLLDARPVPAEPDLVDGAVEVRATPGLLDDAKTLDEAVAALLSRLGPDGYLAVMAYLDRENDAALAAVRAPLAARTGRPVTFGWGPRFLHSTGQFHKGGPAVGVYLQLSGDTAGPAGDLEVPDRPFTFGQLIAAQAAGDAQVLAEHGRPVLRLHLTDRALGLRQVAVALGSAGR
jgi:glucose-6-phosphate isomerase